MSVTLILSGTINDIYYKLLEVKKVITRRKAEGYYAWSKEFLYEYVTARDGRVCPVCESHDGKIYNGEEVKANFPNVIMLGAGEAHPRTHDNPSFPQYIRRRSDALYGCGCRLYLKNAAEGFEQKLHQEKVDAVR